MITTCWLLPFCTLLIQLTHPLETGSGCYPVRCVFDFPFQSNLLSLRYLQHDNSPHKPVQVRWKAIGAVHRRSELGDLQKYEKQIPALAHTQTPDTDVVRALMKEKPWGNVLKLWVTITDLWRLGGTVLTPPKVNQRWSWCVKPAVPVPQSASFHFTF